MMTEIAGHGVVPDMLGMAVDLRGRACITRHAVGIAAVSMAAVTTQCRRPCRISHRGIERRRGGRALRVTIDTGACRGGIAAAALVYSGGPQCSRELYVL